MGLPEIFSTSQTDTFEQTLMMTTFELTSWLVAFVALMTIVVTVIGVIHLMRSESRQAAVARKGLAIRRQIPAKRPNVRALQLVDRTARQV